MCLITFSFDPGSTRFLLLAANRDEFHERPARPMAWWFPEPILAGRDERAGGTWLAVDRDGRWAAVTNVRDPAAAGGTRSRGELPLGFLRSDDTPEAYALWVQSTQSEFGPFNLLVGDPSTLWWASSHAPACAVAPGIHTLSNGALDEAWPKSTRIAARFESLRSKPFEINPLLDLMHDTEPAEDQALPDTGVGMNIERFLSSPFIVSERYGTRCTTVMALGVEHRVCERRFEPSARALGQLDYRWSGWGRCARGTPTQNRPVSNALRASE